MSEKWNDDVMRSIGYAHGLLNFLNAERGQLYGTIIHLMILLGANSIEFPTHEELEIYGNEYYIKFNTEDNKIELLKQEKNDGS